MNTDATTMSTPEDETGRKLRQRRNVRRTTLLLALIAAGFYLGFILMSVSKALK